VTKPISFTREGSILFCLVNTSSFLPVGFLLYLAISSLRWRVLLCFLIQIWANIKVFIFFTQVCYEQ
ncbi:unnamed protein product, partial [Brassica rapa subsp. narinosa]